MAKALSKSQIAASIAEKSEISKKQATEILDHIAQLAYKHAKDTFTLPAKRLVKFRVAKAAKEAILKK
jgi:DNA-binding protein HU-beta